MKKLLILLVPLILLIPLVSRVFADEGWVINNFKSNIEIQTSGEVLITETIAVDFMSLKKHGIYRDIPYIYESSGEKIYTDIAIQNILQNNQQAKYETSRSDGYIRMKIGDPNKTISGKNTYQIEYIARGIIKPFQQHDELYWDVTGNNWPAQIESANATVILPKNGITQTACYEGYSGSTGQCNANMQSQQMATFSSTRSLETNQGMTIVTGFQKNLVPILIVERPKTFLEKFLTFPSLSTLAASLILGIGTVIFFWLKYGRDYWVSQNPFAKKNEKGSIKPLGGHETIVVEFTPPENLTPAEIGVLMDERAHTHDVVATIIDLAARGYLTITEVPKKWLFGKTDYVLTKTTKEKPDKRQLLPFEKNLLSKLFSTQDNTIKVSELKTTFYEELKEIKNDLYKEVVSKNLFPTNPDDIRNRYLLLAIVILVAGIAGTIFSINNDLISLFDISLGIAISGLIFTIVSQFMPRRTAHGRELYRRAKGYYLFIEKAEKYRQQYFEKENLFNQVLPYAIIFGLTGKFAKAMSEIGLKTTNTGWYVGTHPIHSQAFASNINDFSKSISSAIAAAPKSSGFSSGGGFSGGGFSGGGFGGGGGGSW